MAEWKKYTGSDDQIEEIANSGTDVLCRYQNGTERFKSEMFIGDWKHKFLTEYLICNPHPLADMICQQALTGQPVYVQYWEDGNNGLTSNFVSDKTTRPNWNIPGTKYSFTQFED